MAGSSLHPVLHSGGPRQPSLTLSDADHGEHGRLPRRGKKRGSRGQGASLMCLPFQSSAQLARHPPLVRAHVPFFAVCLDTTEAEARLQGLYLTP